MLLLNVILSLGCLDVVVHVNGFAGSGGGSARSSPRCCATTAAVSTSEVNGPAESSLYQEPTTTSYDFLADFTGIKRVIDWKPFGRPVPMKSEISLLKSGVLLRRGEFSHLEGARKDEIRGQCKRFGLTLGQGLILRRQLMVTKVVGSNWKIEKNIDSIHRKFSNQQMDILELSWELNLPPVSIFRAVVQSRVDEIYPEWKLRDQKRLVKTIINGDCELRAAEFLTDWEREQLEIAKASDVVGYQKERTEINSSLWEKALYAFLDEQKINYITEDAMRDAGTKKTPDCLLLDDCVINGHKVRWIDSKSFYASGLKQNWHYTKGLKKQIAKYEEEFGESGAVIFKHGFSGRLSKTLPDTLFLDAGPLDLEYH